MNGESSHHVFWERRQYKKGLDTKFRNHKGLVIPIDREAHRELHIKIMAPLKPEAYMMAQCLEVLSDTDPDTPLWGVLAVAEYFKDVKPQIFDNLMEQFPYLLENNGS